ncbi:MAG: helix-turn-helix domain-containing protein [archaeon]
MPQPRFARIGLFHHDCWHSKVISRFGVLVSELNHRLETRQGDVNKVTGMFTIDGPKAEVQRALSYVRRRPNMLSYTPISIGKTKAFSVTWKANKTAFDYVFDAGCIYASKVYTREGFEAFDVLTPDLNRVRKEIADSHDVGQFRLFSATDSMSDFSSLTEAQREAVVSAYQQGYYSWPRKKNLDDVATGAGKKRSAFHETLRRAESKLIPRAVEQMLRDQTDPNA